MEDSEARLALKACVDRYLSALTSHDPSRAPLAASVKYTENGQHLELGDGFWRTASALPTYKLVITDPQSGQVGVYALMKENGWPAWVALRLKVEADGQISEIETLIKREGGLFSADRTDPDPIWTKRLAPNERSTREAMIDCAQKYFDALEHNLVDHAPIAEECDRITNGMQMTNNPTLNPFRMSEEQLAKYNIVGMSCRDNVNSPVWKYITKIIRRYPIVDEENGIVVSLAVFQCNGTVPSIELPHIGRIDLPDPFRRPFAAFLQETFKIERGMIRSIIVVGEHILPYGFRSGWD